MLKGATFSSNLVVLRKSQKKGKIHEASCGLKKITKERKNPLSSWNP
jgi:hypothetical protein